MAEKRNPRERARKTVERRIHFYRAELTADVTAECDSDSLCSAIAALERDEQAEGNAYWGHESGSVYIAVVDNLAGRLPSRNRLRFFSIRRNDLPLLENKGSFSPLAIPPRGGLAEPVFVAFFPNNIVGAIYNFHGPRLPRLGTYLQAVLRGFPRLNFVPLIRTDALDRLNSLQSLKSIRVRLSRTAIQHLDRDNASLRTMFERAAEFGNATSVEIVLRAGRDQPSLSNRAGRFVRTLVRGGSIDSDSGEGIEELVVKGRDPETGRTATFDLLSENFVVTKQVVTLGGRSRALDPVSAYRAIEMAYEDLRADLEDASTAYLEG